MVRNKEIIRIIVLSILALGLGSCKVQQPVRYVSLYLDDQVSSDSSAVATDSLVASLGSTIVSDLDSLAARPDSIKLRAESSIIDTNMATPLEIDMLLADSGVVSILQDSMEIERLQVAIDTLEAKLEASTTKVANDTIVNQVNTNDTLLVNAISQGDSALQEIENQNTAQLTERLDSMKQLQVEMIALLKQKREVRDTVLLREQLIETENSNKESTETITNDTSFTNVIAVNDTVIQDTERQNIAQLTERLDSMKQLQMEMMVLMKQLAVRKDTTIVRQEVIETIREDKASNEVVANDTAQMNAIAERDGELQNLERQNAAQLRKQLDSIRQMQLEMIALQKERRKIVDTTIVKREVIEMRGSNKADDDLQKRTLKQLDRQSDMIRSLQKEIMILQKQMDREPERKYIEKEVNRTVERNTTKNTTQDASMDMLFEQRDSIRALRAQVKTLQSQELTRIDTAYIEKEVIKTVPAVNLTKEVEAETLAQMAAQRDSIKQLKNQLMVLEKQPKPIADTVFIEKEVVKNVPIIEKVIPNTDSTTLVAYYRSGAIVPTDNNRIINELKGMISRKSVQKITISGYTDSSGSRSVNKAITNKRILYIVEQLSAIYPEENIFSQNFADKFASNTSLDNERKLVITVISRK